MIARRSPQGRTAPAHTGVCAIERRRASETRRRADSTGAHGVCAMSAGGRSRMSTDNDRLTQRSRDYSGLGRANSRRAHRRVEGPVRRGPSGRCRSACRRRSRSATLPALPRARGTAQGVGRRRQRVRRLPQRVRFDDRRSRAPEGRRGDRASRAPRARTSRHRPRTPCCSPRSCAGGSRSTGCGSRTPAPKRR